MTKFFILKFKVKFTYVKNTIIAMFIKYPFYKLAAY